MVDTSTVPVAEKRTDEPERAGRRISPARGLPGGRAVIGALLVAAAAVVTFAAYLDATAAPTVRYVVATAQVEPGTRLGSMTEVGERFGTIALDLPPEVATGVVLGTEVEQLVGQIVLAPLQSGDLLARTHVVGDGGVADAQTLSFSLPRRAAVAGSLRPGERIDVLATYGSGEGAYTAFVVRGVPLLRVAAPDGGPLGDASEVLLTVAVSSLEDVQALGHAVTAADLLVTRSTARAGDAARAPGAYRPEPAETGPRPDPTPWSGDRLVDPGDPPPATEDGGGDDAGEDG
ncbi:MAG: hypothetical protein ACNA8R_02740 [Nitriliruptoraceae bacterium]